MLAMVQSAWSLLGGGLLLACGGGAPVPQSPQPPPKAPVVVPVAEERAPSESVGKYWVAGGPSEITVRADLASLTKTELVKTLLPLLAQSVPAAQKPCVTALLEHGRDVLVRAEQARDFTILVLAPDGLARARAACVGTLLPAERVSITGADEAYAVDDQLVAVLPAGIVLFGTRSLVEAALSSTAQPTPLPAHFTLAPATQISAHASVPDPKVTGNGTVSVATGKFALALSVQLPSEGMAQQLEAAFANNRAKVRDMLRAAGGDAVVLRMIDSVTLERRGAELELGLEARGSAAEQAQALGQIVGFSVSAAQRYALNAKAAEAKHTLAQITKAYQAALNEGSASKPPKPKKLFSLPPVPAQVPRGEKLQTSAEDWGAWAAIKFSLAEPQYFQYEVVAAKNGKSAEVVARGDLDGDGELSVRRLKLALDPKTGQLTAQGLDEQNPLE